MSIYGEDKKQMEEDILCTFLNIYGCLRTSAFSFQQTLSSLLLSQMVSNPFLALIVWDYAA